MEWTIQTPRERLLHDLLRVATIRLGGRLVIDDEDYHAAERLKMDISGTNEVTIETYSQALGS